MSLLDLRFECEVFDDDEGTIRDYLHLLLTTLWSEGEGFSGKRPFGNSGWEYDLYKPLIEAGAVKGELDEDGYIQSVDRKAAEQLVFHLIDEMCGVSA